MHACIAQGCAQKGASQVLGYSDQTWAAHAVCADTDPEVLFVKGTAQRNVRKMCYECPVRLQCLADALESRAAFGVWGGLTEIERRNLLRTYPHEKNWLERFRTGEDEIAVAVREGRVPRGLK